MITRPSLFLCLNSSTQSRICIAGLPSSVGGGWAPQRPGGGNHCELLEPSEEDDSLEDSELVELVLTLEEASEELDSELCSLEEDSDDVEGSDDAEESLEEKSEDVEDSEDSEELDVSLFTEDSDDALEPVVTV